jgi:energy-converting hydrogenase Eha subunit B
MNKIFARILYLIFRLPADKDYGGQLGAFHIGALIGSWDAPLPSSLEAAEDCLRLNSGR